MQKLAGVSAFGVPACVLFTLCLSPVSAQLSAQTAIQDGSRPWLVPAQETDIDRLFSRPPGSPGYAVAVIWYAAKLAGPQFVELMNKRERFQHDKDNDAFGLVGRSLYDHPMLDYSGGDTDTSTYMTRFPEQHITIICLSNMPLGDAEGKADALLDLLHRWGKI